MRAMNQKRRVTIYDIAREAEVSPATVSRVLSGSARVSQKKRDRVLELVRQHSFMPNALAKGLSKTLSGLLGMLVPDVRNPYYSSLFMACEREAYELGYTLILNNTFTREDLEIAFLDKMTQQRVEAMIICGGLVDRVVMPARFAAALRTTAQSVPVIIAGQAQASGCSQISLDHADGMRQLISHLAGQGHTKIAFIYANTDILLTLVKRQAYLDSMAALGLTTRPEYLVEVGHFDEECGSRAMDALLALPEPPTAVIGINDLVSAGVLRSLLERGLRVPQDCAVASFDNSYLADLIVPRLTSVDYDYEAYAARLVGQALAQIAGQASVTSDVHPVRLLVKASTAGGEEA